MIIRKLTKREQFISVLSLIIIFVYVMYRGVYNPFKEKIALVEAKIIKQGHKYAKQQEIIRRAESLNSDYKEYLDNFSQSGSNEQVMSAMISEIEGVTNKLELKISDMKPSRVKQADYFNVFSVSLTISSDFADIIHFLYILQGAPYYFEVEEVQFNRGSRRTEDMKTRLVLKKVLISS